MLQAGAADVPVANPEYILVRSLACWCLGKLLRVNAHIHTPDILAFRALDAPNFVCHSNRGSCCGDGHCLPRVFFPPYIQRLITATLLQEARQHCFSLTASSSRASTCAAGAGGAGHESTCMKTVAGVPPAGSSGTISSIDCHRSSMCQVPWCAQFCDPPTCMVAIALARYC